jgi:hypothetical protein
MMEAVCTSETSVNNHFTGQYIPEDNSEHHTRCRENLKSHIRVIVSFSCPVILTSTDFERFVSAVVLANIPKKDWGFICIIHLSYDVFSAQINNMALACY